ncbi:Fic/DOC family protein [Microbacterium sp. YY-01]|uniref:Fic/DOC family protein n=1 Tax=Microbacterium sp. YY-01 TaxID=3421634 RepID=UPI003D1750BE
MAAGWEAWEAYFYPETYDTTTRQGTLRNKFGERNAHRLDVRERAATAARAQQLAAGLVQIDRTFDTEHLQQIHRHLFQDVYEWAGELRTCRMRKDEDTEFAQPCRGEVLDLVHQVQEHIQTVDWSVIERRRFVNNVAVIAAFMNQAHPFREGNGRSTQWFMRHIAEQARFRIDFARVNRNDWNNASATSSPQPNRAWIDPRPLIPLIDDATVDHNAGRSRQDPDGSMPRIRRDPGPNTGPSIEPPSGTHGSGLGLS